MDSARFFHQAVAAARVAPAIQPVGRAPMAFHRRFVGYAPTPLVSAPAIARMLGVGEVLLKVESSRLGLPAFKILGASWAIYRLLEARVGGTLEPWETFDDLAARLASLRPMTLAAATDGNHGRAVAHMAKLLGFDSRIYVPAHTAQARIDGIASEGAEVVGVDGTYDDAVARAAEDAGEQRLVVSDTSWPGYEDVPRWVMDGYSTIMWEIDDELAARGDGAPDLVAVQFGVGALAAAVVNHYRQPARDRQPTILSVEPLKAACMLASMEAGEIVSVPGPHDSIMAGLNCGRPSIVAWPTVATGIDAFIAVADERARQAMRMLAEAKVVAGETGAAGVAGLIELLTGSDARKNREALGISETSRVLALITEGATDPHAYAEVIADRP